MNIDRRNQYQTYKCYLKFSILKASKSLTLSIINITDLRMFLCKEWHKTQENDKGIIYLPTHTYCEQSKQSICPVYLMFHKINIFICQIYMTDMKSTMWKSNVGRLKNDLLFKLLWNWSHWKFPLIRHGLFMFAQHWKIVGYMRLKVTPCWSGHYKRSSYSLLFNTKNSRVRGCSVG